MCERNSSWTVLSARLREGSRDNFILEFMIVKWLEIQLQTFVDGMQFETFEYVT